LEDRVELLQSLCSDYVKEIDYNKKLVNHVIGFLTKSQAQEWGFDKLGLEYDEGLDVEFIKEKNK
jgi:hypothetical protein